MLDETWKIRVVLKMNHPRRSPSQKQTMVSGLDKVISIPVRVPTLDTRYDPEYTIHHIHVLLLSSRN